MDQGLVAVAGFYPILQPVLLLLRSLHCCLSLRRGRLGPRPAQVEMGMGRLDYSSNHYVMSPPVPIPIRYPHPPKAVRVLLGSKVISIPLNLKPPLCYCYAAASAFLKPLWYTLCCVSICFYFYDSRFLFYSSTW
jgi:hypothetical protein